MKTNKEDPDFRVPVAWLIEESMDLHGYDIDEVSEISKIPLQELNAIMASRRHWFANSVWHGQGSMACGR